MKSPIYTSCVLSQFIVDTSQNCEELKFLIFRFFEMAPATTASTEMYKNTNESAPEDDTPVQKFYRGTNVFITGGTGFMGKILIEKLLRSTQVATIYILIRQKKGKDVHTRLDELFDDVVSQFFKVILL